MRSCGEQSTIRREELVEVGEDEAQVCVMILSRVATRIWGTRNHEKGGQIAGHKIIVMVDSGPSQCFTSHAIVKR